MGFFSGSVEWKQNPFASGLMNQYQDWTNSQALDPAARMAKGALKHWGQGNFDADPTLSALMNPLRNQFASQQRDAARSMGMGGLGLASGSQPALMARLGQLQQQKIGEQEGMALQNALPAMYQGLSNTLQSGIQNRRMAELAGMGGQMQAANMGMWKQNPSILQNIQGIANLAGSLGGMAMGLGGFGGGMGGSGGGGSMMSPAQLGVIGRGVGMGPW